ncbi:MAG: hypothetical protein K1X57_14250 [Gemmataceae bacterium]|nr:hypothetical protein [Gemmataceae bacterium]
MRPDTLLHRWAKRLLPTPLYPRHLLATTIDRRVGRTVFAGPFRGMKYVDASVGSVFYPKLLGCYEKELHGAIEELIALAPATIIDIGAAEGYYAVGLALRCPQARVIAFEENEEGRALLAKMAAMNGVAERMTVRGRCTPAALAADLGGPGRTACVCDVEGGEAELLDPAVAGALRNAWILVELHDFLVPGTGAELARRFAPTHQVTTIGQQPRTVADYPFPIPWARWLPLAYGSYHVQEFRPAPMSWLVLRPRAEMRA